MTGITTSIASLRTGAYLDTRKPGRYQALDTHHTRLRRRQQLAADRLSLAAEVTRKHTRRTSSTMA